MLKLLLLLTVCSIFLLPLLFQQKLQVEGERTRFWHRPRRRSSSLRWKGPKTDERINGMLQESISMLKELGVPISESICPVVRINGSHHAYGMCWQKGSKKMYSEYDFYIELSGYTLGNTEKSLRCTLIHELLHTVPGGQCHTGEWKKWANIVNEKTDYHIRRCDGDGTEQDRENLRYGGLS